MTGVLWSVSVQAVGDRAMTHEEIVGLADAVAAAQGVASGIGAPAYGAQLVVEAADRDEAMALGRRPSRKRPRPPGCRPGRSAPWTRCPRPRTGDDELE